MTGYGINRFDAIYFINLEHRKDRLKHILGEIEKVEVDFQKVHRIDAIRMPFLGILGCGKSHKLAMETFIRDIQDPDAFGLFLEDDFQFYNDKDTTNLLIDSVFNNNKEMDVFMLSSYALESEHIKQMDDGIEIRRVIRGQTLSGYAVKRSYAPKLLENYKNGIKMLETLGYGEHEYCVDVHVKELQKTDMWLYTKPSIGCQMESYSDIQNEVKNYGL
jgi:GR25 family glycosyltransferase involved in LPS biosynthesis